MGLVLKEADAKAERLVLGVEDTLGEGALLEEGRGLRLLLLVPGPETDTRGEPEGLSAEENVPESEERAEGEAKDGEGASLLEGRGERVAVVDRESVEEKAGVLEVEGEVLSEELPLGVLDTETDAVAFSVGGGVGVCESEVPLERLGRELLLEEGEGRGDGESEVLPDKERLARLEALSPGELEPDKELR